MTDVTCPSCDATVTCDWKCQECGKPRPFGVSDGVGSGSQTGDAI